MRPLHYSFLALALQLARADWVLTFEDDFTGTAINTSSWTVSDHDATKSRYDGHDALFVNEGISVSGGNLVITTTYAPGTVFDGVTYNMVRLTELDLVRHSYSCTTPPRYRVDKWVDRLSRQAQPDDSRIEAALRGQLTHAGPVRDRSVARVVAAS